MPPISFRITQQVDVIKRIYNFMVQSTDELEIQPPNCSIASPRNVMISSSNELSPGLVLLVNEGLGLISISIGKSLYGMG
jgi:hypothetical protein